MLSTLIQLIYIKFQTKTRHLNVFIPWISHSQQLAGSRKHTDEDNRFQKIRTKSLLHGLANGNANLDLWLFCQHPLLLLPTRYRWFPLNQGHHLSVLYLSVVPWLPWTRVICFSVVPLNQGHLWFHGCPESGSSVVPWLPGTRVICGSVVPMN